MTQTQYQHAEHRAAKAVAVSGSSAQAAGFSTLILSVLLVLLSGAVWTQLT
ncbi:hypothetical protein BH10PSE2_BH10PSE2_00710 [soil metagenome]